MEGMAEETDHDEMSDETKALLLMREKLPTYVIDSFIAAGFNTLKVISEIDIGNNGLDEIEQYVTNFITKCASTDYC